jgi:four helix bundle protein
VRVEREHERERELERVYRARVAPGFACHAAMRAGTMDDPRPAMRRNLGVIASSPLRGVKGDEAMTDTVQRFRFQQLDVYRVALKLAAVVHKARIGDAELRDQATRAVDSVFLNLSEGLPAQAVGVRRRHFTAANGSLHEVVAALTSRRRSVPSRPSLRRKRRLWRSG